MQKYAALMCTVQKSFFTIMEVIVIYLYFERSMYLNGINQNFSIIVAFEVKLLITNCLENRNCKVIEVLMDKSEHILNITEYKSSGKCQFEKICLFPFKKVGEKCNNFSVILVKDGGVRCFTCNISFIAFERLFFTSAGCRAPSQ